MLKKTIEFINCQKFENSLNLYKQKLLKNHNYDEISMYFHIFFNRTGRSCC